MFRMKSNASHSPRSAAPHLPFPNGYAQKNHFFPHLTSFVSHSCIVYSFCWCDNQVTFPQTDSEGQLPYFHLLWSAKCRLSWVEKQSNWSPCSALWFVLLSFALPEISSSSHNSAIASAAYSSTWGVSWDWAVCWGCTAKLPGGGCAQQLQVVRCAPPHGEEVGRVRESLLVVHTQCTLLCIYVCMSTCTVTVHIYAHVGIYFYYFICGAKKQACLPFISQGPPFTSKLKKKPVKLFSFFSLSSFHLLAPTMVLISKQFA